MRGASPSRNGNKKSFARERREAVECVHEVGGERRYGSEVPEDFGVSPGGFTRSANAPGREGIFQTRGSRECIAQKSNTQLLFCRVDNAVERGVQCRVVVVALVVVLGCCLRDLTSGVNCLREVVIDVSVNTSAN